MRATPRSSGRLATPSSTSIAEGFWPRLSQLAYLNGFTLVVLLLPQNDDVYRLTSGAVYGRAETDRLAAQVREVVPFVVDQSNGPFNDSRNFWLFDSRHFRPEVGARMVEDAVERTVGTKPSQ